MCNVWLVRLYLTHWQHLAKSKDLLGILSRLISTLIITALLLIVITVQQYLTTKWWKMAHLQWIIVFIMINLWLLFQYMRNPHWGLTLFQHQRMRTRQSLFYREFRWIGKAKQSIFDPFLQSNSVTFYIHQNRTVFISCLLLFIHFEACSEFWYGCQCKNAVITRFIPLSHKWKPLHFYSRRMPKRCIYTIALKHVWKVCIAKIFFTSLIIVSRWRHFCRPRSSFCFAGATMNNGSDKKKRNRAHCSRSE